MGVLYANGRIYDRSLIRILPQCRLFEALRRQEEEGSVYRAPNIGFVNEDE